MKGPGIKDYLEVIENMKVTAQKEGKAFIEVNSKELHANVSPNHATMPTCCQAIYKLMLEGDGKYRLWFSSDGTLLCRAAGGKRAYVPE